MQDHPRHPAATPLAPIFLRCCEPLIRPPIASGYRYYRYPFARRLSTLTRGSEVPLDEPFPELATDGGLKGVVHLDALCERPVSVNLIAWQGLEFTPSTISSAHTRL